MRRLLLGLTLLCLAVPAAAGEPDWEAAGQEAVERLIAYLQVNTSNPPGNELLAARFFQQWFEAEGIAVEVIEFEPGRANLVAWLPGSGVGRPLLLMNHSDVVTADPSRWRAGPFSGDVLDGYLYGRGALDMKGEGLVQAMVFVLLKRAGVPLKRDVYFIATADEEVAFRGAFHLMKSRPELLRRAEFILTEGGNNLVEDGQLRFVGVDNAEKAPFWLRLRARGVPGHGSRPLADAATHRLVRALARVAEWQTPIHVLSGVERFFRDLAAQEPPERAEKFRHLRDAVRDPAFLDSLTSDPAYNYLLRITISITVLEGGPQTNVIPGEAVAHLDVRLLPGQKHEEFLAELRRVLDDDGIAIEMLQNSFRPATSSPTDTEVIRAVEAAAAERFPGTLVTTLMLSGYTECGILREMGPHCYGFSPFLLDRDETATEHGDNERVSVENLRRGLRFYYDVVERLVRE